MRTCFTLSILLIMLSVLPGLAFAEETARLDLNVPVEVHGSQSSGTSRDDLLYGYMLKLGGKEDRRGRGSEGRQALEAQSRVVYDALSQAITRIAAGQQSSSNILLSLSDMGYAQKNQWTEADLGVPVVVNNAVNQAAVSAMTAAMVGSSIDRIVSALQADYPYELFWYDKVQGYLYSMNKLYVGRDASTGAYYFYFQDPSCVFVFQMKVAQAYQNGGEYVLNTEKIASVSTAAENAGQIVQSHKSESDFSRLTAYKDAICSLVSYDASAEGGSTPYGDPWQLIYVFDGDPATNVVCEGYAKAFQYLFDLSYDDASPLKCRTVTGTLQVGRTSGNHMWNIVQMEDGKNYVADITNCDSGKWGEPDGLFLKSMIWLDEDGFYYFRKFSQNGLMYSYNAKTLSLWGASALAPASADYGKEDVTDEWLSSWSYQVENGKCVLLQHTSYESYVVVPSQAVVHGNTLSVVLRASGSTPVFKAATQRLYVQKNVQIEGNILAGMTSVQILHLAADSVSGASMGSFFQDCTALVELQVSSAFLTEGTVFPAAHGSHADVWYSLGRDAFFTPAEIVAQGTEDSDTFLIYDAVFTVPQYVWSDDSSSVLAYHQNRYTLKYETERVATVPSTVLAPTCTEEGSVLYTASFAEETFGVQTRTGTVTALGHDPVRVPAVPATQTEDGTAKGMKCGRCSIVLEGCASIDHGTMLCLPSSVSVIGEEAFASIAASQVILAENVAEIGPKAFAGCEQLAVVRIPASVTVIAGDAFENDPVLTLWVDENSCAWEFATENGIDWISTQGPDE